jgi:hypothetical protein
MQFGEPAAILLHAGRNEAGEGKVFCRFGRNLEAMEAFCSDHVYQVSVGLRRVR